MKNKNAEMKNESEISNASNHNPEPQVMKRFHETIRKIKAGEDIQTISLTACEIGDNEAIELADTLNNALQQNPNIKIYAMYLSDNNIGDDGAIALATVFQNNPNLDTMVNLGRNYIGAKGLKVLIANMSYLLLENSNIDDELISQIADALKHSATLRRLNLARNLIGTRGGLMILNALENNYFLLELDLQNNLPMERVSVSALENNNNDLPLNFINDDTVNIRSVINFLLKRNENIENGTSELLKKLSELFQKLSVELGTLAISKLLNNSLPEAKDGGPVGIIKSFYHEDPEWLKKCLLDICSHGLINHLAEGSDHHNEVIKLIKQYALNNHHEDPLNRVFRSYPERKLPLTKKTKPDYDSEDEIEEKELSGAIYRSTEEYLKQNKNEQNTPLHIHLPPQTEAVNSPNIIYAEERKAHYDNNNPMIHNLRNKQPSQSPKSSDDNTPKPLDKSGGSTKNK